MLDEVGLSLAALHEGDCLVDLSRVIRVLDNAARQLECADFGMRVASHQGIVMLGLLGKLNVRIAELNDGPFVVDDQETPRVEAL